MKISVGDSALVVTSNSRGYRKWAGNKGYEDELGLLYDFDDAVALWHKIQLGSVLLISRDAKVIGLGVVHELRASRKLKEFFSCPLCIRQSLTEKADNLYSCTRCKKNLHATRETRNDKTLHPYRGRLSRVLVPR